MKTRVCLRTAMCLEESNLSQDDEANAVFLAKLSVVASCKGAVFVCTICGGETLRLTDNF